MTTNEKRWIRAEKRYRIPLILRVAVSPKKDKPTEPHLEFKFHAIFGGVLDKNFVEATHQHATAMMTRQRPMQSLKDVLNTRADNLFNLILLFLGIIDYASSRFENAAIFMHKLDERLISFRTDEHPRKAIRWLRSACLCSGSSFPGNAPLVADDLVQATEMCRRMIEQYGVEFPFLHNVLARDLFYMGELEEALKAAETAFGSSHLDQNARLHSILNRAVLSLFLSRYADAHQSFVTFFQSPELRIFDWNDLIAFADFALEYGHPNAIYIMVLYRRFAGRSIETKMDAQFQKWVQADTARNALALWFHSFAKRVVPTPTLPALPHNQRPKKRKDKRRNQKRK